MTQDNAKTPVQGMDDAALRAAAQEVANHIAASNTAHEAEVRQICQPLFASLSGRDFAFGMGVVTHAVGALLLQQKFTPGGDFNEEQAKRFNYDGKLAWLLGLQQIVNFTLLNEYDPEQVERMLAQTVDPHKHQGSNDAGEVNGGGSS